MPRFLLVLIVMLATRVARAEGEAPAGARVGAAAGEGGEAGEHHHGPWEMRVSVESPLYAHSSLASTNIFEETELEPNVMISYVLEEQRVSFDLEVGEGWVVHTAGGSSASGPSGAADSDGSHRTGTTIRPGVAYMPSPTAPIFITGMLPIHLEPSPVVLSLRLGAGVDVPTPIGKWFVEADVDFPLAGGDAPNPFQELALVLGTGLLFHLPG